MGYLESTRAGYDATAAEYAARFHHYLDDKPVDLAMLSAFAGLVRSVGQPAVLDVGCGTGATTALLHDHGLAATGIDLSPRMIDEARRLSPHLRFRVGSAGNLGVGDASVGGVCAWYSLVHVPDEDLASILAEFARVLTPRGVLLLAFQVGSVPKRLTEAFGVSVDLLFHRRTPAAVTAALDAAGLEVYSTTVREPDDDGVQSTPQAFMLARKPAATPFALTS